MVFPCIDQSCVDQTVHKDSEIIDIYLSAAMNILLIAQCWITTFSLTKCLPTEKWPRDASEDLSDLNFDFIIVGAGSAGSVLANRLSEVPNWRVLLIEAGGNPPFVSTIPSLALSMQKTPVDWQYSSEVEYRTLKGLINGRCLLPRGKMLGGTSSLNGMVYVRGNPKDYDDIAANGNPGWEYREVLKYFIKSENLTQAEVQQDPVLRDYHGYEGPLHVEKFATYGTQPITESLISAFEELGSPRIEDLNGPSQLGTVRLQGTLSGGRRVSTATAYLVPAAKRPNLIIWKQAVAAKILLKHNIAMGVSVILKNNKRVKVKASKEVVLSGGTYNTPQLLMLSGIGPRKHLEKNNIKVIADLPVGENLYDHFVVPSMIGFRNGVSPIPLLSNAALYVADRTGIFAQIGASEVNAMINTKEDNSQPDMQIVPFYADAGMPITIDLVFTNYAGYNKRTVDAISALNKEMSILFTLHTLLSSRSRGKVLLRNTDPKSLPRIFLNFLNDERDIDTIIRALEYTSNLVKTKSFRKLNATLLRYDIEECNMLKFPSKSYWRCLAHNLGQSAWHPLGTAKMGSSDDPTSVVDPFLRVRGVHRLRVVDGSVIPSQISGNTNAPIIMFAEKASDLIKADY